MGRGSEEGGKVFGGEAVLGLLGGELDLDEDGEGFAEGAGGVVEALGDAEGVDGVDGVEELGGAGGLVGLEGANEVHLRGSGSGGGCGLLLLPLLDAVFAEEALAGGVSFEEGLYGMDFADGHEGDVGERAIGAGAGFGDLGADLGEIFGDGHERFSGEIEGDPPSPSKLRKVFKPRNLGPDFAVDRCGLAIGVRGSGGHFFQSSAWRG